MKQNLWTQTQTARRLATVLAILAAVLTAVSAPAGAQPTHSLGGLTFLDADGDGEFDDGEARLSGITVQLSDSFGNLIDGARSNSVGGYGFGALPAGEYSLEVGSGPPGSSPTTPTSYSVTLAGGVHQKAWHFGFAPDPPAATARIGGLVFSDIDGDGVRQLGEPGLGGVTVQLSDSFGAAVGSTRSTESGVIVFNDLLAGEYFLEVGAGPTGSVLTTSRELSVELATGQTDKSPYFGFKPPLICNDLVVTVNMAVGEIPTAGDDVIRGTAGADVINGGGGNDTICALQGDDVIDGGAGFDKVFAGGGNDTVAGGDGNDLLIGGSGDDTIRGGNGNDRIQGGDGVDTLEGDNGSDRIAGGNGNDILRGGRFADQLFGNLGRDQLFGDEGDDVLRGGAWLDEMDGGPNQDGCTLTDPAGLVEIRISCESGVFGL